jgi:O-antigen ligase
MSAALAAGRPVGERARFSFVGGVLLGIPLAYPSVPYYWLAFAVFASFFMQGLRRVSRSDITVVLAAMTVVMTSNLVSIDNYNIEVLRIFFTTLFFSFFLFGSVVPNRRALLAGFTFATQIMSIGVILAAVFLHPFSDGILMFTMPEHRLWGDDWFPDWPNFLAFMLSLGFLLNALFFRRPTWAIVQLAAALLTTSRTPLLAAAIYVIFLSFEATGSLRRLLIVGLLLSLGVAAFTFIENLANYSELTERMGVISDREDVYGFAWDLFLQSPWLGNGSVLLDESVGNLGAASYHNSYLDILVRHGLLGFLFFVALIWPGACVEDAERKAYWAIVCFFVFGALVQNFFKHPHLIMIYSTIVNTRGVFFGRHINAR